jgi:tRNA modification GTPase
MNDTIFAAATAAGRAAVAVVRVSGPRAGEALSRLAGGSPRPRRAALRTLRDEAGEPLDDALTLWFPGPASYTGEDSAEFHVHGGTAVVDGVLEALRALGLRLAEPGEFTRRAFENGKLDLAQAEGVADLIDAETRAQRRQALRQLGGALSEAQETWRERLTEALAVLEAAVDFPDEEVPADVAACARPILEGLIDELRAAASQAELGERVREGFRIALIGAPNAGKSTLLNALVRREAAIVTATPGTTRDVIEVPLVLGGYKVLMADTAGLRETTDEIEAEGVRRARAWSDGADLKLWVIDGAGEAAAEDIGEADLCVLTKADLPPGVAFHMMGGRPGLFHVAASAGQGIDHLRTALGEHVAQALAGAESASASRLRHRDLLTEAADRLGHALVMTGDVELAAEDVRLAGRALDRITGRIHPEDVLGRIFSTFCIGK